MPKVTQRAQKGSLGGVNVADLTTAVTESIRAVLEARPVTGQTPPLFRNPRIIVGIIIEPPHEQSGGPAAA